MKRNTKIFSLIMAACMSISLYVPAYAAELPNELKEGNSPISEEVVSSFLWCAISPSFVHLHFGLGLNDFVM